MALTITVGTDKIQKASAPVKMYKLSFPGEASYVKGTGTAAFEAAVQAAVSEAVTLMAVVDTGVSANPKYIAYYDEATDSLRIRDMSAADEATSANLSGTTFYVTVLCV